MIDRTSITDLRAGKKRQASAAFSIALSSLAVAMSMAFMSAPQLAHAQEVATQINIQQQPLSDALLQLGQQTSLQFIYSSDLMKGLSATSISGRMMPEDALRRLLAGTGIQYSRDGNNINLWTTVETTQLAPVTVVGSGGGLPPAYAGGQVATGGRVGMLGNLDFMETPFSTVAYTEKYMNDIQATNIGSVIGATDASVYVPQQFGLQESFLMRGFSVGAADATWNGLPNMAPLMRGSTEMVERMEVQKGPSAMLRGASPWGAVGGSINLIPKRAGDEPLTRLTATYQSDKLFGIHADVGRRFGENQAFGLRFNGVLRDGDVAVDDQKQKMGIAALALDWRSDNVRLSADVYRQREHLKGLDYFGIQNIGDAVTVLPAALKGDQSLAAPWNFVINSTTAAIARAEWDVNDNLTAYASYGHRDGSYDAIITQMSLLNDAGDIVYTPIRQYQEQKTNSAEVGVQGEFVTGPVNHAWSLAGNYTETEVSVTNIRTTALNRSTNFYALDYGVVPGAFSSFSKSNVLPLLEHKHDSMALADRMSFMDDKVQFTLGVRRQRLRSFNISPSGARSVSYNQTAYTPSLALLVKVAPQLSVYGSYIQALSAGGTAPATAANANEMLSPFKSEQYEFGAKYDMGNFAVTASLFEITKPSAYTDPVTNIYSATGEQRNRGLELNVFGEVQRGLRLMGGMTYLDATLKNQLNGLNEGNRVTGVPKIIARMGAEYDLAAVPGLTLTGRLNYVDKRYATADNRLSLPSYITLDFGARYATKVGDKNVVVRASVDNLTNKAYWAGSWGGSGNSGLSAGLGASRTFMLSASVDF